MSIPADEAGAPARGAASSGPSFRVRASRGTLVSLAGQGSAQLLRLAGNLVLARLLFPEAFGVMAKVYLVVFALDQISNTGIPAAIMRFERGEKAQFLNTAFTIQVVRGFALWLLAAALAPAVADFYREPELRDYLPAAAFAAVIMGFISPNLIVLTRRLELGRVVAIEIAGQLVALVVMIAIAWVERSVWALVIGGLANQLTIAILSHVWVAGPRSRIGWDRGDARSIFSIGRWVFASSGLSFLLAQMDVALLGRLIPTGLLGVYAMGAIIPNLLRDISFRISSSVLAPIVAESNRESRTLLQTRYAAARRLTLPTALGMALGAAAVAPAFFDVLYDHRYADAGWIAQLALVRFWFAYVQVTSCQSLLAMGDGRTWAISNLFGLVGVTTGCLVGFQQAELAGLLIGMGLGAAVGAAVPLFELRRIGVGSPLPEIGYTLIGAAFAGLLFASARTGASWLPIPDPTLRPLLANLILVAPIAVWSAWRVLKAMRAR